MKKGVDNACVERTDAGTASAAWRLIPTEHNVGHLYKAPETLQKFYRENDPTNEEYESEGSE